MLSTTSATMNTSGTYSDPEDEEKKKLEQQQQQQASLSTTQDAFDVAAEAPLPATSSPQVTSDIGASSPTQTTTQQLQTTQQVAGDTSLGGMVGSTTPTMEAAPAPTPDYASMTPEQQDAYRVEYEAANTHPNSPEAIAHMQEMEDIGFRDSYRQATADGWEGPTGFPTYEGAGAPAGYTSGLDPYAIMGQIDAYNETGVNTGDPEFVEYTPQEAPADPNQALIDQLVAEQSMGTTQGALDTSDPFESAYVSGLETTQGTLDTGGSYQDASGGYPGLDTTQGTLDTVDPYQQTSEPTLDTTQGYLDDPNSGLGQPDYVTNPYEPDPYPPLIVEPGTPTTHYDDWAIGGNYIGQSSTDGDAWAQGPLNGPSEPGTPEDFGLDVTQGTLDINNTSDESTLTLGDLDTTQGTLDVIDPASNQSAATVDDLGTSSGVIDVNGNLVDPATIPGTDEWYAANDTGSTTSAEDFGLDTTQGTLDVGDQGAESDGDFDGLDTTQGTLDVDSDDSTASDTILDTIGSDLEVADTTPVVGGETQPGAQYGVDGPDELTDATDDLTPEIYTEANPTAWDEQAFEDAYNQAVASMFDTDGLSETAAAEKQRAEQRAIQNMQQSMVDSRAKMGRMGMGASGAMMGIEGDIASKASQQAFDQSLEIDRQLESDLMNRYGMGFDERMGERQFAKDEAFDEAVMKAMEAEAEDAKWQSKFEDMQKEYEKVSSMLASGQGPGGALEHSGQPGPYDYEEWGVANNDIAGVYDAIIASGNYVDYDDISSTGILPAGWVPIWGVSSAVGGDGELFYNSSRSQYAVKDGR